MTGKYLKENQRISFYIYIYILGVAKELPEFN